MSSRGSTAQDAVTSVDRLLFSTDYPFQQPTRADVQAFFAEFSDDEARTAVSEDNARRLFRLDGAARPSRREL